MTLDDLVRAAIDGEYYTADGKRVMLALDDLVKAGLLSPALQQEIAKRARDIADLADLLHEKWLNGETQCGPCDY